jgi:hypothetical protein
MENSANVTIAAPARATTDQIPPHAFFLVSALFHYLGPSFAVLLFARVDPLGVAWLRIASAAVVFGLWCRPWRYALALSPADRRIVLALGIVLAAMNSCFYLAIARLPLGTVGAIEFLGPIGLAAIGLRSARNVGALGFAMVGVFVLTDVRFAAETIGYLLAFANCALFVLYIVLGHRIASRAGNIDRLGAAMLMPWSWRCRSGLRTRCRRCSIRCCWRRASASVYRRRSFRTCATSLRWHGCRGRVSRCCCRCCRQQRQWSAWWCCGRSLLRPKWWGSPWSSPA